MIALPQSIDQYFAAANGRDAATFAEAFAEDAEVTDEGRTYRGRSGIRQWREAVERKYTVTSTPLSFLERDGRVVVTALVEGDFPKAGLPDPLHLEYRFEMRDDLIGTLEIGLPR
jgi:ketosteroid isomerase-like protein